MATTTTTTTTETITITKPPPTKLVCFSFAAYSKTLINHLKSLNIPILPGLTDDEFSDIESIFNFTFPPDLRSLLQEGLPMGPSFPNWRSSSQQQLHLLLNLPFLSLSKNISLNNFWSDSWGKKPQNKNDALCLVKKFFEEKAPVLVPVYRNCYVPCTPNMAGNPVFYIDVEEVKILSFDLSGFFKEIDRFLPASDTNNQNYQGRNQKYFSKRYSKKIDQMMPVWAAKEAKRIEFWTEVAERGKKNVVAREDTFGWWSNNGLGLGLECCMEEVFWRLRDGGWREEEVKEMMMMDGCDDRKRRRREEEEREESRHVSHVSVLSLVLLRGGWTREDVVYSLSLDQDHVGDLNLSYLVDDDNLDQKSSIKKLTHVHSLEVFV